MLIDKNDFLKNITNVKETNYLTHGYHPYAAKFIPQIPRYFIERYTTENEIVLDPFCGSGTALVESLLLRRNAIGIDIHPIGVLVSKVKTTPLSKEQLKFIWSWEKRITSQYIHSDNSGLGKYLEIQQQTNIEDLADKINFPNKYHWFKKDILNAILYIKNEIDKIDDRDIRDFLYVALSSIIVKVSNQESETRYVAVEKNVKVSDVFDLFRKRVEYMVNRMNEFSALVNNRNWVKVYQADSRRLNFLEEDSVDFIVTSPPYPNTYDYYLYHKLRMFILGFDVKFVQENEIGSRHRHSSKRESIDKYLKDMKLCFENFRRVLKSGRYFVIVVGDSIINGVRYCGFELIKQIADETGFKLIDHVDYDLDKMSKLFNKAFRTKNKREHVIVLKNEK